jgi:hypothetical protein
MPEIKKASLRDSIIESIGNFLYEEGFEKDDITKLGILEIINLISDYHEEGNALFPEILVTNSLDFFKTIPNKEIIIQEADLSISEFKNALKLCAPLATNSWIIFIEVKSNRIKYGITSAEMSETSPSIYNQTVGQLKVEDYQGITIAYIRNIGQKTVELAGLKNRLIVSLTLDEPKELSQNEIQLLCEKISSNCDEKLKVNIKTFFEKIIDEALKNGHGNLIGIVDDNEEAVAQLKETIKGNGGIYLSTPIDFESLITDSETNKNNESSINLKTHSSVLKSMLNHDGITIISNKGKVIGYHILIDSYLNEGDVVIGGARSKAFKSMENCGLFILCFYKSQDGNLKISEIK